MGQMKPLVAAMLLLAGCQKDARGGFVVRPPPKAEAMPTDWRPQCRADQRMLISERDGGARFCCSPIGDAGWHDCIHYSFE